VIKLIKIFEQGSFQNYSQIRLDSSTAEIPGYMHYSSKTTVFISHKHDDLEDLKGVLGFLESQYGVRVYIDSQDPAMPKKISNQTAYNLKMRIKQCDKFILLATNNAIESKWCNWELGYGDAQKYRDNIALFPLKPKGAFDTQYKGTEYMSIYPYISFYNGTEYNNGLRVNRGYYVVCESESGKTITPLKIWLKK